MSDKTEALLPLQQQPLITFAVFAYNQEKYISEAIAGAFSQTYERLEIILSDDCSTDKTFEIMKEMADSYVGSHIIRLNKNTHNMGIGAHVNKIHRMARGSFIVHAAGDDISYPERAAVLFNAYSDEIDKPSLIVSDGIKINQDGKVVADHIVSLGKIIIDRPIDNFKRSLPILGCTAALSKSLVYKFEPLPEGLIAEDALLYRRAYLLGGIKYVPNKLVKYRVGNSLGISSVSSDDPKEYIRYYLMFTADSVLRWKQLIRDMELLKYDNQVVLNEVNRKLYISESLVQILNRKNKILGIKFYFILLSKLDFEEIKMTVKIFLVSFSPKIFLLVRNMKKRLTN